MLRFFFKTLFRIFFRYRAFGTDVLDNTQGPVLLVPNHLSWLDWLFVGLYLDDDWKFATSKSTAQTSWIHRRIMMGKNTFPVDYSSPYSVKEMARFLQSNGRLVLFAEGRMSTTGRLMKLFDGTGFLIQKTGARVITCYLRNAQRVPYSPHPGRKELFPKVTVHFGKLLTPPKPRSHGAAHVREETTLWLRQKMIEQQFEVEMEFAPSDLLSAVAKTAKERPKTIVLEDVTEQKLTHRKVMIGADVLASRWHQKLDTERKRVGVLLPNVNATPVVLLSLWIAEKIPAILNYSTGVPMMAACSKLSELRQVITSHAFLRRANLDLQPMTEAGIELIFLEDLREEISPFSKVGTALKHYFKLNRTSFGIPSEHTAVVLFTSGSEGAPKGVELTHRNILANLRQMVSVADITDTDRLFNCLPLFHSFGLTVGTFLPLAYGNYTFIYPSPLHYRVVPTVIYNQDCTIFLSTNTFLNGYARKAHPYDFHAIRYLFAAAEKLQEATAITWAKKFGIRLMEGYGATECSPCVTVNTNVECKSGSVGRLMPGMDYKIEPVDGVEEGGRLLVKGPNVMKGYLNKDANAAFQSLGGWYDTGDIISVDNDGYFYVRGRLKRFAKVSGEMVSLTAVEEALAGAFPQYGLRCQVAVIARPDAGKGEVLVAVTNEAKLRLQEVREAIKAQGMTNLCVPRELKFLREIPIMGTGKINHRELQKTLD